MRRLLSLILIFFTVFVSHAVLSAGRDDVERALSVLDDSLARSESFIALRQAEIDRLCDSLSARPSDADLMLRIADRYTAFNNDSAMHYLQLGIQSRQVKDKTPFMLRCATLLPLSGYIETANNIYDSITRAGVADEYRRLYYDSGRQMYSYMAAFLAGNPGIHKSMQNKSLERQARLLEVLDRDSPEYNFNLAEYYFQSGELGKAKVLLEEVSGELPPSSNLYARATHHLSSIAQSERDSLTYTYYLAKSALSDVTAATREVASLQELGKHLYTTGDVNRAYTYLTSALACAVDCAAPLRMIESSRSLPIIERAKTEQLLSKQRTIMIALILMGVLMLGLVATLLLLRREMKRMSLLQENLRQANRVKEVYISQFLNLCSIYMDKLNQFCKVANRKIAAGKVDDLYRLTKSGKFVEEQSHEFYSVFDNAFIHLYPNFVSQVNALLRPDAQIELKDGEQLNTDLRILAFMRLGIEESSRIAQVLNYSLNTIYAYRNRTKARAINRDTFEDDVMKIPSTT